MNASERSNFAFKGEHAAAPAVSHTFGVYGHGYIATHISIELAAANKLRISTFSVVDGAALKVGEVMFDLADAFCWQDRWAILTTPTHYSWDGADNPDYDPLFMLTMPIATLGVGAMAIPLSQWWRFVFAVAVDGSLVIRRQRLTSGMLALAIYSRSVVEDDWFLYAPALEASVIRQISNAPDGVAIPPPEGPLVPAAAANLEAIAGVSSCHPADDRSPSDLYLTGMSYYRASRYEPAFECLRLAAEAPASPSRQAMEQLCIVYELGHGVAPDMHRAKLWCERAYAP